ncbi:MAG: hypothetical protein IPN31_12215 [Bacteroidetes bacterium]|nr:hypothetical protein [Bacteroidota bacterium]
MAGDLLTVQEKYADAKSVYEIIKKIIHCQKKDKTLIKKLPTHKQSLAENNGHPA